MATTTPRKNAAKKASTAARSTTARKTTARKTAATAPSATASAPARPALVNLSVDGQVVRFSVRGADKKVTKHVMPDAAQAASRLSGEVLIQASLDETGGSDMRLLFQMLNVSDIDPAARAALGQLPAPALMQIVSAWADTNRTAGAPLGESSSSSA